VKNFQPNFSHIYIEESAKNYPLSKLAIKKFSKSTIIEINHYKDVFNRPNQDFQIQKSSMKLILAKKNCTVSLSGIRNGARIWFS
jgi:spore photoproduct lyase